MAVKKKKSQAEKAAANSGAKKKTQAKKTETNIPEKERVVPVRVISSIVLFALFVLFLIISFSPEGALTVLIENILHGLFGRVGFLVSVPVLLYMFVIHVSSKGRPIIMRSVCLGCFALAVGCISHLYMNPQSLSDGIAMVADLYTGGIAHTTGGVICGLLATLIHWLFDSVLSYILLIVAALLTLLGGMQITIPSIVRAIRERPRADWEGQPEEPRPEPASVVINHIANKRIAYMENRKKSQEEKKEKEEKAAKPERKPFDITLAEDLPEDLPEVERKKKDMIKQIDADLETPVAAAQGEHVSPVAEDIPEVVDTPKAVDAPKPDEKPEMPPPLDVEEITAKEALLAKLEVEKEIAEQETEHRPEYCFPPIDLLKLPVSGPVDGSAEMRENARLLNETLASFKIEAHIVNVTRGPSVTRYEVELEKGVRLNKLTNSAVDIALSLGAPSVRIAAIPGKISVVGIEVPNQAVNTVSLREVIDSKEFTKAKPKASFAVGKDIGGNCIVGNIARLPHMLIAGTTGSGKSVCMNSIIISLLYKASPDDVKLIMVDPKMVELGIYNGIPHLLIPVVTDPKKAAGSLQWAVAEMMRRYKIMSDAGVRDMESYNSMIESEQEDGKKLAQVVVIIDELADLMLVAAKEVEDSICRIAQMGRAAGIHLIIATQRPSADVITGLMKANIPSRIAFSVASAMESRIILDTVGAEKLVGKGDMLYAPIGEGKPKRVQGCFVSDAEVEAVATYVKSNFTTEYDQKVMAEIERKAAQTGNNKATSAEAEPNAAETEYDEMLPAAVDIFLEIGQASVSMLQRRLKLGYSRAARIVDEMEEQGIVGPYQGSKPRAILITKAQWEAMKGGQPAQLGFEDLGDEEGEDPEDSAPF